MSENKGITRREMLRMSAYATAGMMVVGCGGNDKLSENIDKGIYEDLQRASMPVDQVVKRLIGGGSRPNVVLILTDDMGYGDLACYGGQAINTPRIDQMAREGARFTDFYACTSLCSPSRAGLLTGRYPMRTGISFPVQQGKDTLKRKLSLGLGYMLGALGVFDMHNARSMADGLPPSEITIAEALKVAGYNTCGLGKWHLGDFGTDMKYHPYNHGFDYFCGFAAANDDWPIAFWRGEKELIKDIGLDQSRYTRLFTDEAINFMKKSKDNPFFVYLAHKDPHQPCFPSEEFIDVSEGGRHGDTVQELDYNVGRILDYLKENGLEENTLVIFTSDNGPWFDGSPGGLRGRKGESYEGGYRVPMIARAPGMIPAGLEVNAPVMNFDFFPTLLHLAGLEVPDDRIIDGKDIQGLMRGQDKVSPHDVLYFFHYCGIEGMRRDNWKLFREINTHAWPIPLDKKDTFLGAAAASRDYQPEGSDESVPTLGTWPILYNMKYDKGESYNVIKKYPEVAARLLDEMKTFEKVFYANPRGWKK